MAAEHRPSVRTATDHPDVCSVLLTVAFAAGVVVEIVSVATGVAILLASLTDRLGGFVLLAGGWIAVVTASPAVAKRGTQRLDQIEFAEHAPRSSRPVRAAVALVLPRKLPDAPALIDAHRPVDDFSLLDEERC